MEESKKFYGEVLGLELERCFEPMPDMTIVFYKDDKGFEVELIYDKKEVDAVTNHGVSIGIKTNDFEGIIEKMKLSNIKIKRGPMTLGGDTVCLFIEDPNGLEIQIIKD